MFYIKSLMILLLSTFFIACGETTQKAKVSEVEPESIDVDAPLSSEVKDTDSEDNLPLIEVSISESEVDDSELNEIEEGYLNGNLYIPVNSDDLISIHFRFDKYNLDTKMVDFITHNVEILNSDENKDIKIRLEGNSDEWGSDEYNYSLALKRAMTVKKAFIEAGVSEDRISTVSYGESNPTCLDKTQLCWAKNRRVDIILN